MPWIATISPPAAPLFLSALKVVAPAHKRGAASTEVSSPGMLTNAEVRRAYARHSRRQLKAP